MLQVRFFEGPNGAIVILDVTHQAVSNEIGATKLRGRLSRELGGCPVLLRCRIAGALCASGEPSLLRYALDPMIDALPLVGLDLDPPWAHAA
jgi:hypothetical protein